MSKRLPGESRLPDSETLGGLDFQMVNISGSLGAPIYLIGSSNFLENKICQPPWCKYTGESRIRRGAYIAGVHENELLRGY
jgi:hypothetical protein